MYIHVFSNPCKGNESTAYYQIYQLTILRGVKLIGFYINVTDFYIYVNALYVYVTDFYNF